MSREFETLHPDVQIPVAGNGTSAGFKKFLAREAEICDASRPITEGEIEKCQAANIEYVELQVAIDGLAVVVNKDNDWVDEISVADLKKIWDQDSEVKTWKDVNPEWPDQPLELFGAGTDSGTFDYFTEAINGQARRSRSNYSPSENDNILVSGVTGNKYSMGYFGFAYYVTSADKLKALKIIAEGSETGVAPTPETVENGTYTPLSRPLFLYVNKESLKRPEVKAFLDYYLSDVGQDIVEKRKYVRLNSELLAQMRQRLADAVAQK
jgi:phosphate transport system substrate-binding protein